MFINSTTVMYLYPRKDKANDLKIFQDMTSQIEAFYFKRNTYKELLNFEQAQGYSVYFLISEEYYNEEYNKKMKDVYIGQSVNGIRRIINHEEKKFWKEGLLFTANKNAFDVATIDFLEYHFINTVKEDIYYNLINKDMRIKKPYINIYISSIISDYINQINFLLSTEGIVFNNIEDESKTESYEQTVIENKSVQTNNKILSKEHLNYSDENVLSYHEDVSDKYEGRIYITKDFKIFIEKGSLFPLLNVRKDFATNTKNSYRNMQKQLDKYLEKDYINFNKETLTYEVVKDIEVNSLSTAAQFLRGRPSNGWDTFKNVSHFRGVL